MLSTFFDVFSRSVGPNDLACHVQKLKSLILILVAHSLQELPEKGSNFFETLHACKCLYSLLMLNCCFSCIQNSRLDINFLSEYCFLSSSCLFSSWKIQSHPGFWSFTYNLFFFFSWKLLETFLYLSVWNFHDEVPWCGFFFIHYAGHTLYSAKQETHVLHFWAFLCTISFIRSSPPLFFFLALFLETSMICLLEQSSNALFLFFSIFLLGLFVLLFKRCPKLFISCSVNAPSFLLEECINYVSGDTVDFSKLCSAVCIVSFISVSFFHLLVLVLRLFATVSASARRGKQGALGASLGSLSSQLWALIHI